MSKPFVWKKEWKKLFWLLPGIFFYAVFQLCTAYPAFTEAVYARAVFPAINRVLSALTGLFFLSLGEWVLYTAVLALVVFGVWSIVLAIRARRGWWRVAVRWLAAVLSALSMAYALFVGLWGINYARQPLSVTLGLDTSPASVGELYATCHALLNDADALRALAYEEGGPASREDTMRAVSTPYDALADELDLPFLGGYAATVKPVAASIGLCYARIEGIYSPFTGEANVNMESPLLLFPATCLHEAAHQRGFAREDEANFLAYYASTRADGAYMRYSGTMLALIYAMDALRGADGDLYNQLWSEISGDIARDLDALGRFWQQYETPVGEVAQKANDAYLRANKQRDGVRSYGRMVDLLIGLWRSGGM